MRLSPIAQASTNRLTITVKGIIILLFLLIGEIRSGSAMRIQSGETHAIKESVSRKKSPRSRQQMKRKQHAVVYACSYKRKSKPRPSGFSYYR